jgi:hypothetical protein
MGYFQDLRTCGEHGFALSPEGTCVRCRSEAGAIAGRRRAASAFAAAVFATTLLGLGAAWARHRPPLNPSPPVSASPDVVEAPVVEVAPEQTRPPVTSPASHAALDAWEKELARAEAARVAEALAKAAAEKRQIRAATEVPASDDGADAWGTEPRGRVENLPSSTDHPSWWQEPAVPRIRGGMGSSIAAQQRAMSAAGVAPYNVTNPAAWLPPNNGGHFQTRH